MQIAESRFIGLLNNQNLIENETRRMNILFLKKFMVTLEVAKFNNFLSPRTGQHDSTK
jgi:hypothetical protein